MKEIVLQITEEEFAALERAEEDIMNRLMPRNYWECNFREDEICTYVPRCTEKHPMTWEDLKAAMASLKAHHHGVSVTYLEWYRPVVELHYDEAGIAELCGHPEAKTFRELVEIPVEEFPETKEALAHALITAIHEMRLAAGIDEDRYFEMKDRTKALAKQVLAG